ncbi:uncharacterized protein LOC115821620 [Chanos chanos]|uniref:Uncharacterized protein LOC115821620 n=1 Tax=Chanos chanos TaxID=29144 RepID=A0A6J2W771_CHACN|nr:uncharacterized protein LOC115821620 [Chanos chanos]
MVIRNNSLHYEINREILGNVDRRMRSEEKRAKRRMTEVQNQRKSQRALMGAQHDMTEVRIVLLGSGYTRKNSAGNIILGTKDFDLRMATHCVNRQKTVAGMKVFLVEPPGWWINCPGQFIPKLDKSKIVLSVSLCPPGPHAFLLVIDVDASFTEMNRRALAGHLEPLDERVWKHIIILFINGDSLGDETIEQYIESEGKALQWLIEKCGNRYHVFNTKKQSEETQVTELLEKIEEMVAANGGHHYILVSETLQETEEYEKKQKDVKGNLPKENLTVIKGMVRVLQEFEEETQKVSEGTQKTSKKLKKQMKRRSLRGSQHCLTELRLVLLGYKCAGKSSAGNTILGRGQIDLTSTAQCVMRHGEMAGRQVTVVEAPGWVYGHPLMDTPERIKQEIVRIVSLCPPGPHAMLLVLPCIRAFTALEKQQIQEILELFGSKAHLHTIVLFTCVDLLRELTTEQYIKNQGEALKWLLKKCGNRHHVLNNSIQNSTQVIELLQKIEGMVAGNKGCHLDMDRRRLQEVEERRRAQRESWERTLMNVQKQRVEMKSQRGRLNFLSHTGDLHHLSEVGIVLLGYILSGKSSTGNTILGISGFTLNKTLLSVKIHGEVAGRLVTVVDTPGWWRNDVVKDTPEVHPLRHLTEQEILRSVTLCGPGPHAFLLVIPVLFSFSEEKRRCMIEHLELLGNRVWSHCIVLFTYGDTLGEVTIEQYIECEGEALHQIIQKCGGRYHVFDNRKKTNLTQVTELLKTIEEMVADNRGQHYETNGGGLQAEEQRTALKTENAQSAAAEAQMRRADEGTMDLSLEKLNRSFTKLPINKESEDSVSLKSNQSMNFPPNSGRTATIRNKRSPWTEKMAMSGSASGAGRLSELRIILLGNKGAGKTSAGNTLLGREEFDLSSTTENVIRHGKIEGRQVTLIEAPGWSVYHSVELSSNWIKQHIVHSVSLCPPGPHALLLVINLNNAVSEKSRRSLTEHLELLGEKAWNHTVLLFTNGDSLEHVTVEQCIDKRRRDLKELFEKCGNRYHVFDSKNLGGGSKVRELLDKIEGMVIRNNSLHYEINREILGNVDRRMRSEEKRAKRRMTEVQNQRKSQRALMGAQHDMTAVRIVLLGSGYTRKNSAGNIILGTKDFDLRMATHCVNRQKTVAGMKVFLVEPPGWWINCPGQFNPKLDKSKIVLSVSLCPPGPHAFLLVIDVDASFTEMNRRALAGHLEPLDERVWKHIIILFINGDSLGDETIEQYIESEGKALQWLIEKCGNRYHVFNTKKQSEETQVTELLEKIEEMVAANGGHHYILVSETLQETEEYEKKQKDVKGNLPKENLTVIKGMVRVLQEFEEETQKVSEGTQKTSKKLKKQMKRRSLRGSQHCLTELRLVLLGYKCAGKSSAGNTILGRGQIDLTSTAQCVMRHGETAGRQVTVVEAPGWVYGHPLMDTPERIKQEIVRIVSLCPPGPHAMLLVLPCIRAFTALEKQQIQEILELFGSKAHLHTIVLFTCVDLLKEITTEQYIKNQGKALKWLLKKCGNRHHVLNNSIQNSTQVIELLQKIEGMVAGNKGCHLDMDRRRLQEVEERRRAQRESWEKTLMNVQKQRVELKSQGGHLHHLSEVGIVLLGYSLSGKSSTGNTILGISGFTQNETPLCLKRREVVAGRLVTVVDTPGWWKNDVVKDTPEVHALRHLTEQEILRSVTLCGPGPLAFLLVIPVLFSFSEDQRRAMTEHLELLGNRVWSHCIVLFTYGDSLGEISIEQYIECEGEALHWLIEKCGGRYHVFRNMKQTNHTQVTELLKKIEDMVADNRAQHYAQSTDTGAQTREPEQETFDPVLEKLNRKFKMLSVNKDTEDCISTKSDKSMEHPPNISNEERYDTWSIGLESSGYGSVTSGSVASSGTYWSLASSATSGADSLSSTSESERTSGHRRTKLSYRGENLSIVTELEESG